MKMWLGEGGIRTLGALLGHGALAKLCFQPLSHLTKSSAASENMAENCRLPTLVAFSMWPDLRLSIINFSRKYPSKIKTAKNVA